MTTTTLYRLFDTNLRLLYIGIAGNPGRRFEQHAGDKQWWSDVAHVRTQHFDSRDAAAQAERQAIQEENPRHNIIHSKPRSIPRTERDFDLICTACGRPGADYLEVDNRQSLNHDRQTAEIEERVRQRAQDAGHGFQLWNGSDLLDLPDSIPWQAWHRTCDPRPQADTYWIEADRISRWEHVADWTAHLMGKNWFKCTDWQQLLRGLSTGQGRILQKAAS